MDRGLPADDSSAQVKNAAREESLGELRVAQQKFFGQEALVQNMVSTASGTSSIAYALRAEFSRRVFV